MSNFDSAVRDKLLKITTLAFDTVSKFLNIACYQFLKVREGDVRRMLQATGTSFRIPLDQNNMNCRWYDTVHIFGRVCQ